MKTTKTHRKAENRLAAIDGSRRAANMQERPEIIREAAEKRPQNRKPRIISGALDMDDEFLQ